MQVRDSIKKDKRQDKFLGLVGLLHVATMLKNPLDQAGGLPVLGEDSLLFSRQNEGGSEMRPFGVSLNYAKAFDCSDPATAQPLLRNRRPSRCGQSIIGGTRRISFGKSVSRSPLQHCLVFQGSFMVQTV